MVCVSTVVFTKQVLGEKHISGIMLEIKRAAASLVYGRRQQGEGGRGSPWIFILGTDKVERG